MHGGAPGSGAPRGNKNALKHGRYTREAIEESRLLQSLLRESRVLIQKLRWSSRYETASFGANGAAANFIGAKALAFLPRPSA